MSLFSRIAKKIRRRFRKKGTAALNPPSTFNIAERLIANNWNIRFDFIQPARKGVMLAAKWLAKKLKANEKIPSLPGITRQVARHQLRRMVKLERQETTVMYTRRNKRVGA